MEEFVEGGVGVILAILSMLKVQVEELGLCGAIGTERSEFHTGDGVVLADVGETKCIIGD